MQARAQSGRSTVMNERQVLRNGKMALTVHDMLGPPSRYLAVSPNRGPSPSGDWRAGRAWRLIPNSHDPLVTAEARLTVHVLLDLVPNSLHGSAGRAHLRL